MTIVLDSSIAAAWCFPDEVSHLADKVWNLLANEPAVVPGLWWYEIHNVLVVNERRGRITTDDTAEFLADLAQLPLEIAPTRDSIRPLDLARKHKLTFYDASYLALAVDRQAALATLDRALINAARAEGIDVLV